MRKKLYLIAGIVVAVAIVAAGIYIFSTLPPAKAPPIKLGVTYPGEAVYMASWWVVKDRDLLRKHGVEMIGAEFTGGTGALTTALAAGEIDVAIGIAPAMGIGIEKGVKAKIVATLCPKPLLWVVAVLPDSPIKTLDDLKSKTIGVSSPGSGSHLTVLVIAKAKGWDVGTDIKYSPLGKLDAMIAALKRGTVDAIIWTYDPIAGLIEKGDLRIVARVDKFYPTGYEEIGVVASEKVLRENPEAVKRVIAALLEASKIWNTEREYAIKLIMERLKISRSSAEGLYEYYKFSEDGSISIAGLKAAGELFFKAGALKAIPDVTKWYDARFVPLRD